MLIFFKSHMNANRLKAIMLLSLVLAMTVVFISTQLFLLPVVLVVVLAIALFIFRQFTLRNFGGVSGDLLGASIEGMEVVLWVTLLLCA
ncbi:adenosylcobinamide-GDP ribazoletransferase [Lysinibacillus boronitolerans]|uniref:adenosylcobinamide-GDP ribazoletransferase n=1 Tax=Lysinibacillus boronitolerans TaxID=309788 RepID=UPI002379D986|nr:adenosylcobinamide-GDP ribazoletransferase [Lysinibacillus boronitolerans]